MYLATVLIIGLWVTGHVVIFAAAEEPKVGVQPSPPASAAAPNKTNSSAAQSNAFADALIELFPNVALEPPKSVEDEKSSVIGDASNTSTASPVGGVTSASNATGGTLQNNATTGNGSQVPAGNIVGPQTSTAAPLSPNLGAIIGGSVGGVLVMILLAGGVIFMRRRRKQHRGVRVRSSRKETIAFK